MCEWRCTWMFVWLLCILISYSHYVKECWVHGGFRTRFDMLMLWDKKWKASSHRECNLGLLVCVTSSELWPPENHQASQSSICTTQGVLNIAHSLGSTCSNMAAVYYPIVWWSAISAIIDAHLFDLTKLEVLRYYLFILGCYKKMAYAYRMVPQGVLSIGRQFEITFCSKDGFNAVERQLIQNAILCHVRQ